MDSLESSLPTPRRASPLSFTRCKGAPTIGAPWTVIFTTPCCSCILEGVVCYTHRPSFWSPARGFVRRVSAKCAENPVRISRKYHPTTSVIQDFLHGPTRLRSAQCKVAYTAGDRAAGRSHAAARTTFVRGDYHARAVPIKPGLRWRRCLLRTHGSEPRQLFDSPFTARRGSIIGAHDTHVHSIQRS